MAQKLGYGIIAGVTLAISAGIGLAFYFSAPGGATQGGDAPSSHNAGVVAQTTHDAPEPVAGFVRSSFVSGPAGGNPGAAILGAAAAPSRLPTSDGSSAAGAAPPALPLPLELRILAGLEERCQREVPGTDNTALRNDMISFINEMTTSTPLAESYTTLHRVRGEALCRTARDALGLAIQSAVVALCSEGSPRALPADLQCVAPGAIGTQSAFLTGGAIAPSGSGY